MGTWGPGNFDSDTAADHLSILVAELVSSIEAAMTKGPPALEPDEYDGVAVPCNVELLALLGEQHWVGVTPPLPATVAAWKQSYLAVWDAKIDTLSPNAKWKRERRAVLVKTFDRLAKIAVREHGAPKKSASGVRTRRNKR